ncbi:hypothetical protein B296_00044488, partial [Ensete ventricosum]
NFDRYFVHHIRNSKYWPFPTYKPIGNRTSTVSRKNAMVINFVQSHRFNHFSCTVSKIQNTGHSQCISPWEIVRARFW